jgi:hypothetical protein
MRRFRIFGAVVVAVTLVAGASYADKGQTAATSETPKAPEAAGESEVIRPLQLALVPSVQLVNEENSIHGIRLNIYGRNRNVSGVDIGLAHETSGDFHGISFGLMNIAHGEGRGLQFSAIYSEATARMAGLQVGMVNRSNNMHGLQIGLANFADDMTGIQIGLWNEIKNKERWNVFPIVNAAF